MKNITYEGITEAVIDSINGTIDPRLKEILSVFIKKIHETVKELELSHDEWEAAIGFLFRSSQITTEQRNEFVLMSDLLGISSLVDMIASKAAPDASERSVLGPFYIENAPFLDVGGDLIKNNKGDRVIFQGFVRSTTGEAIAGALLDVWQNAANGEYSNVDPTQSDDNLRCRMLSDETGYYGYSSIRPVPYQIPDDGPGGEFMAATGRHCWRPAHLHARVSANGYGEIVTEIFNSQDDYIDDDATFGVRESLTVSFNRDPNKEEQELYSEVEKPYKMVDFDFVLQPLK